MAANKLPAGDDSVVLYSNPCNGKMKKSRQKCSESRKIRKPLMEKKRRARINHSLNELKRILLEANGALALNKEGNRPTKLEKADILELTVTFLQSLQLTSLQHQRAFSPASQVVPMPSVTSTSNSETDNDGQEMQLHKSDPMSPGNLSLSPDQKLPAPDSSFLDGFVKCTNIIETVLHKNLRPRQNQQIQRKLSTVIEQHLKDFCVHAQPNSIVKEENNNDELDCVTVTAKDIIFGGSNSTYLIPTRLANGTLVFAVKCNHGDGSEHEDLKPKRPEYIPCLNYCPLPSHLTEDQTYHYGEHDRDHTSASRINSNGDSVMAEMVWRPW